MISLPARKLGGARSPKATWNHSKSNMIPDRQRRVKVKLNSNPDGVSDGPITRARAKTAVTPHSAIVITSAGKDGRCGYEPLSISQALNHATSPLWKKAIDKEEDGLDDRETYTRVTMKDVPSGVRVMDSKLVFKDKRITGPKVRVVVRGDQQRPKPEGADTFAATPSPTEVRMLLAISQQNNRALHTLDISQAFLQADPLPDDANIFVKPPSGSREPPGTIWKLKKPLYGLAVAPRAWSDTLRNFLTGYGFTSVNHSDTFLKWTDPATKQSMHLIYHVDDILLSFSDDAVGAAFKTALLTRFKGTDEGPLKRYLGCTITRTALKLHLSQALYAQEVLERFNMSDCNPVDIPMDAGYVINKSDSPDSPDLKRTLRYQEITGSLQFLVSWTRPDLSFCTNELAKVNSNPSEQHLRDAYRVLRYLKGTATLGLTYTRGTPEANRLIAFADADFAACTDTRRSISAYVCMLNGACISWKSKQQKAVSTSTSQAEFVSASGAADEVLWLRRTLADLDVPQNAPTPLWEDNRACRMMSENPVHRERSKHIDYRAHSLRERVNDGVVRLLDCPTADMTADMGTKSLPSPALRKHRDAAMGTTPTTTPSIPADLTKRGGGSLASTLQHNLQFSS
jgi:hypothetical protein